MARRSQQPSRDPDVARLSSDAHHDVEFFKRRAEDDHNQTIPGLAALVGFPPRVRARLLATLAAVAEAPPKRFAGGGQWEAMHGTLTGFFEARVTSKSPSGRMHYRLFCVLDYDAQGASKPILCVIDGESKPIATTLSGALCHQSALLAPAQGRPTTGLNTASGRRWQRAQGGTGTTASRSG